ncbi:MAG: DUF883 domain-containing protein [Gammaproteobacteria bacterium]|nr:DUF883 domain-containing protein [Gammaproteobacteria bacterium]
MSVKDTHSNSLLDKLDSAVVEIDNMLKAVSDAYSNQEFAAQAAETLELAKGKLATLEAAVVAKAKFVAQETDEYVHENPWKSIGIAAGLGVLLGVLLSRR